MEKAESYMHHAARVAEDQSPQAPEGYGRQFSYLADGIFAAYQYDLKGEKIWRMLIREDKLMSLQNGDELRAFLRTVFNDLHKNFLK